MSVEGFVANLRKRESELTAEIAVIIKADKGRRIAAHMRSETKELEAVRTAIHKATRKGVRIT